jgi:hypothetical protein
LRLLALTLLLTVIASVLIVNARGGGGLSTRQIAFWDRVAGCEEHGAWWQGGGTYVGGLGIWRGNWWAWARHVGVRSEASATSRLDQMRVAQWGYENVRAYWGCFAVTGYPIVEE